jgi:hypothetical protein
LQHLDDSRFILRKKKTAAAVLSNACESRCTQFFRVFGSIWHDLQVKIAEEFRAFKTKIFDGFERFHAAIHVLKNFTQGFFTLPRAIKQAHDFFGAGFRYLQTDESSVMQTILKAASLTFLICCQTGINAPLKK